MVCRLNNIAFLFRLSVAILLLSNIFLAASVEAAYEEDVEEEDYDEETEEGGEDFTDDYLSEYAVYIDPDHDCRDQSDHYINCTEVKAQGLCEDEEDLLEKKELCPVTCGLCEMPPRTAVWLDYDCFKYGEEIQVFFTNIDPEPRDYIGIYPAYLNFTKHLEELEEADMWLHTCGSVVETCRTAMGGVIFSDKGPSPEAEWNHFPLQSGKYKAALVRGDESEVLAESHFFTAKAEGHSCYSDCHDLVYTDQVCYQEYEKVQVSFENCVPRSDDHIAIYPASEEDPGENEPLLWIGTCGSKDCTGEVMSDTLTFGEEDVLVSGRQEWPLLRGEYRAFLMRSTEGGAYGRESASSSVFTVLPQEEPCYKEEEDL